MDTYTGIKKFQLITDNSPDYETARAVINSAYAKAFDSTVTPRPAVLLTLAEQCGSATDYLACVAFSQGIGRRFFSEQYLPGPAEDCFSQALGAEVQRDQIAAAFSLTLGGLAGAPHPDL